MKRFLILPFLFSFFCSQAQTISISGHVSCENIPVNAATVVLQNTNHATITNENGKFRLSDVPPGEYVLQITSIGYLTFTKTITAANKNLNIQVPLLIDIKNLDSVTVQLLKMKSGFTRLHDVEGPRSTPVRKRKWSL